MAASTHGTADPICENRGARGSPPMIGFHFSVYRLMDSARHDIPRLITNLGAGALNEVKQGERIAVWQTGIDGLDWINELVKDGRAVGALGTGYPGAFFALARHVLPV